MRFSTTIVQLFILSQALILGTHAAQAQEVETLKTYGTKSYDRAFTTGLVRTGPSQEFLNKAPHTSFVATQTSVPSKYSLRGTAGPVEDQGQCGSCWDFSLTSTLRGTLMLSGKDPGRLSFNYLLNCATTMYGCDGGDFSAADFLTAPQGAPAYGSDGAYTATAGNCSHKTPIASTKSYQLLGSNLGQIQNAPLPSFKDIAYVVGVKHQPVAIDISADDEIQAYSGGVFNGCSTDSDPQINHMVVIEGYSCETNVDSKGNCVFDSNGNLPAGVGTWIIRNSWGKSWGDKGYLTMKATNKKGERCNAVASDALYYNLN